MTRDVKSVPPSPSKLKGANADSDRREHSGSSTTLDSSNIAFERRLTIAGKLNVYKVVPWRSEVHVHWQFRAMRSSTVRAKSAFVCNSEINAWGER